MVFMLVGLLFFLQSYNFFRNNANKNEKINEIFVNVIIILYLCTIKWRIMELDNTEIRRIIESMISRHPEYKVKTR